MSTFWLQSFINPFEILSYPPSHLTYESSSPNLEFSVLNSSAESLALILVFRNHFKFVLWSAPGSQNFFRDSRPYDYRHSKSDEINSTDPDYFSNWCLYETRSENKYTEVPIALENGFSIAKLDFSPK